MNAIKKIIIKLGTSTLTQGTGSLCRRFMLGLVQQIAELQAQGVQTILVSSGAVAAGRGLLGPLESSKRVFASVGQVKLMQVWAELFSLFDLQIGQVLLTRDDFSDGKKEFIQSAIENLLLNGVVPILNENDTTASKEGRIGDNDNLAALAGNLTEADLVILLTDQEGLYTANPRLDPNATLIPVVEQIDAAIFSLAGEASSLGTGGMATKIEAAQISARSGIRTVIASSSRPRVLIDLVQGHRIGTLFLQEKK